MRRGIVTVGVLLAVVFAGIASARPLTGPIAPIGADGAPDATAVLSNATAGAQSALTLKLHGELQCRRLLARRLVVHLPGAMEVPATIARGSVTLGGVVPLHVAVKDNAVTLTAPIRRGAICDVIGPGWFPIAFKGTAGLRNPAQAGSFGFSVSGLPGGRWSGTLTVH